MILCIETATRVCSVAVCSEENVIAARENHEKKTHASLLTVFIDEILSELGMKASGLEAVAVSRGPGSYTGLRIGVSTAKGIAYAAKIPLIGIDTTFSMFHGMKTLAGKKGDSDMEMLFCPMIDARRMEVYYALYDSEGSMKKEINASVIDEDTFSRIPAGTRLIISGDGAEKCRAVIQHENLVYYDDFMISARDMAVPAYEAFQKRKFEDVAYFEPFYLKDFIATIPKKNLAL